VLRIDAYQPRDNILKREIETSQLPSCPEQGISVLAYWPLMKGVLAGKMLRPHRFDLTDIRQTSPIFR
jgi:aryl-alcohol dehydrogenase-like predicted oxidoreductase